MMIFRSNPTIFDLSHPSFLGCKFLVHSNFNNLTWILNNMGVQTFLSLYNSHYRSYWTVFCTSATVQHWISELRYSNPILSLSKKSLELRNLLQLHPSWWWWWRTWWNLWGEMGWICFLPYWALQMIKKGRKISLVPTDPQGTWISNFSWWICAKGESWNY